MNDVPLFESGRNALASSLLRGLESGATIQIDRHDEVVVALIATPYVTVKHFFKFRTGNDHDIFCWELSLLIENVCQENADRVAEALAYTKTAILETQQLRPFESVDEDDLPF